LRSHAQSCQALVMPFRYGGEELVVIAANTRQEAAAELAEEMRRQIGELMIDGLRVTVSIGVAGTPAQAPASAEALLKLADEALYAAKQGGRNQVQTAPRVA
jgi:diguanylate cyclase (GGDEF)-like protein